MTNPSGSAAIRYQLSPFLHHGDDRIYAPLTDRTLQRGDAGYDLVVAAREGAAVFAVGGFVRDLLLERPNEDLDLVVEGDGLGFARALASALGGRVREHEAFLTAVVVDPEGFAIDVATARSEFYRAPAALPEVQSSVLRQDLYRRDFTINSLAIRLGPEGTPELLDFFGGQRDLTEGRLRVLHSLSFIDDPTRVLRAVRLEQRLGFRLAAESIRLVEVALREGVFDRLSGSRLRDELEQLAAKIKSVNARIAEKEEILAKAEPLPEAIDTAAIEDKIRNAENINAGARKRAEHAQRLAEAESLSSKYADLTSQIEAIDKAKVDAIANAKLPIPELSIGDDDIILDGLPFEQASTARKIRTATSLLMALKPELRVLLVREGSLLDDDAREALEAHAKEHGFVVLMECVGNDVDGGGVVIENGEVADNG